MDTGDSSFKLIKVYIPSLSSSPGYLPFVLFLNLSKFRQKWFPRNSSHTSYQLIFDHPLLSHSISQTETTCAVFSFRGVDLRRPLKGETYNSFISEAQLHTGLSPSFYNLTSEINSYKLLSSYLNNLAH